MLQFIKGDIQSGDLLSYILDTEKIDTVMHFAAQVCPWAVYSVPAAWVAVLMLLQP